MLAIKMENRCKAFTQEHRPCRLTVTHQNTCDVHKNYFVRWFETHRPLTNIILERSESRIYKEYNTILSKGLIRPTDYYLLSIPDSPFYYDFYLYLCSIDGVNPLWNKTLFKRIINYYMTNFYSLYMNPDLEQWRVLRNNMKSSFKILFSNQEATKKVFQYVVHASLVQIVQLQVRYDIHGDTLVELAKHFFRIIYDHDLWRGLFLSGELKNICNGIYNKMILSFSPISTDYYLNTVIYVILEESKTLLRSALKERCSIHKEGIMMAAWHPDRVEMLLKAGIDFDSM